MSVTFWCPQAPMQIERDHPFEDDPDYTEEVPLAPFLEINMANDNAQAFLEQLGYHDSDLCGTWKVDDLDIIFRKLMCLLNTKSKDELTSKTIDTPASSGKMRIIEFGRDEEYVNRRLSQLLQLVQAARSHGFNVNYS